MKDILIVLLIVAVALLIVGAANNDQPVDLDYIFGTWHQVSLFTLIAVAAAVLLAVGLTAAALAALGGAGDRRKLERELEQTYGRLRESEARAARVAEEAAAASAAGRGEAASSAMGSEEAAAGVGSDSSGPGFDAVGHDEGGPVQDHAAWSDRAASGSGFDGTASDDRTRALDQQPGRDDI